MLNRRSFGAICLSLLMVSISFAGSGGSKKDPVINLTNDSAAPIAAFVNPPKNLPEILGADPSQEEIEEAGGQVINPGATAEFKVKAGDNTVFAGPTIAMSDSVELDVAKGSTTDLVWEDGQLTEQ